MQAFDILQGIGGIESAQDTGRDIAMVSVDKGIRTTVPLSRLFLSPFNVRTVRNEQSITELAATIEAQGLLNPLCVIADEKKGKPTGRYGVVAGGRRLAALQYLAGAKRLPVNTAIECTVFSSARAVDVSLTENVEQEKMHPADEMQAFKKLVDQGRSSAEIAAAYGVTALTVTRRLRLANLAPMFMELFKLGKIGQDQLQELALEPDHARQIAVWESLPHYCRSAYHLRDALTKDEVLASDSLAAFVGVDAYQAAGGAVRPDLFGDEVYLQDAELLRKLATERMEQLAEEYRAQGWKWVEVRPAFDYRDQSRFQRVYPTKSKPTDSEVAVIEDLDAMLRFLRMQLEELEEASEERELTDDELGNQSELEEQIENVGEQRNALTDSLSVWSPKTLAKAGVVLTLNHSGLSVHVGLVRPEDQAKKGSGAVGSGAGEAQTKPKADLSKQLMSGLTAHRTAAVSAALIQKPQIALVSLLHTLIMDEAHPWKSSPVRISLTNTTGKVSGFAQGFDGTPAAAAMAAARERWGSSLPSDPAALFRHLMDLDVSVLLDLLGYCVAQSYDVVSDVPKVSHGFETSAAVEAALGLDMADWWSPTDERYLRNVSIAKMMEAVEDACGASEARAMEKMKKADAVVYAAARLDGKRWLPQVLRKVLVDEDGGIDGDVTDSD